MKTNAAILDAAIAALRDGRSVVLSGDWNRQCGGLIMAAEHATPADVNFMTAEAGGLICVALARSRLEALGIPPMVDWRTDEERASFHVTVDSRLRTSTGISATDRARTITELASPSSRSDDFVQPGHVLPLASADGGVTKRAGRTEAALDLVRLAGLHEVAVHCEILEASGETARPSALEDFADRHGMPLLELSDLVQFRLDHPETPA